MPYRQEIPLARLFVALGGLLILVLTAALVGPYFVDWSSYRENFEREASRIFGRDVEVRGTASARILPFPSVTFTDVVVRNASGEEAMTVSSFAMDAELAPFLSGEVLIFDMRIDDADVVIRLDQGGMPDWAVRPSVPVGADNVTLENVTVTNGSVRIVDGGSGREHVLSDVQATLSARSLAGPWRADGMAELDGIETAFSVTTGTLGSDGGMRLRLRADPVGVPLTIDMDGNARIDRDEGLGYRGEFRINASTALPDPAITPPPPADYRLRGQFALRHDRVAADQFMLETGPVVDPYTAEGTAVLTLGAEPRFDISAQGVQLRVDEAVGGSASFDERLSEVSAFFANLPRPTIPGRIAVDLPAVIAGDTTIRDVQVTAEPDPRGWRIASASATLPGRTRIEANGLLGIDEQLDFEGDLLLAVRQPSGFAAWLSRDVDDAIRRLPAAGFSAEVRLSEREQAFRNLELALGSSVFRGEVVNRDGGVRPEMQLRLEGDGLDVDGIAAFASLFVTDGGRNRFADRDLDLEIAARDMRIGGLAADSVDAAMQLRRGQLTVERLEIDNLAGTAIRAFGMLQGFPVAPTGELEATVVSDDLAPLLSAASLAVPQSFVLAELVERAGLDPDFFRDVDLLVNASGGAPERSGALTITAQGQAGGNSFDVNAAFDRMAPDLKTVPLRLDVTAELPDATDIYTLVGRPSLPLGSLGQGRAALSVAGIVAEGADLSLSLEADDLQARIDGMLMLSETGSAVSGLASVQSGDLEPWLLANGTTLPGFGFGLPVELSSEIDFADGLLVASELAGRIAEQPVTGDLNIELRNGRPHVTGALGLDSFDLALPAEYVLGADALAPADGSWSRVPFAQAAAMPFTAEISVVADRVSLAQALPMTDASMTLRMTGDGMGLTGFSADGVGGRLTGSADIRNDLGTALLTAQLQMQDLLLGNAFADGLDGQADVSASLTATGKSIAGVVAALSGSGSATVEGLTLSGLSGDALDRIVERADLAGRDAGEDLLAGLVESEVRGGTMRVADGEFAFSVAGGALRAAPVALDANGTQLTVQPGLDLNTLEVAVTGSLVYAPGPYEQVGSQPEVGIAVLGPLDAPRLSVDATPMVQFLTQRALELEQQRVEAMQASLLEQQRLRREVRYFAALADERAREDSLREQMVPSVEDAAPLPAPPQSSLPPSVSPEELRERAARAAQIQAEQSRLRAEEEVPPPVASSDERLTPTDETFFLDIQRFLQSDGPSLGDEFDTGN